MTVEQKEILLSPLYKTKGLYDFKTGDYLENNIINQIFHDLLDYENIHLSEIDLKNEEDKQSNWGKTFSGSQMKEFLANNVQGYKISELIQNKTKGKYNNKLFSAAGKEAINFGTKHESTIYDMLLDSIPLEEWKKLKPNDTPNWSVSQVLYKPTLLFKHATNRMLDNILSANIDGLFMFSDKSWSPELRDIFENPLIVTYNKYNLILEIKTHKYNSKPGIRYTMEEVKEEYYTQVQYYMWFFNIKKTLLAAYFKRETDTILTNDLEKMNLDYIMVERDDNFILNMLWNLACMIYLIKNNIPLNLAKVSFVNEFPFTDIASKGALKEFISLKRQSHWTEEEKANYQDLLQQEKDLETLIEKNILEVWIKYCEDHHIKPEFNKTYLIKYQGHELELEYTAQKRFVNKLKIAEFLQNKPKEIQDKLTKETTTILLNCKELKNASN